MKANRSFISILLIFVLLIIGGCTHNNGDIGPLFGKWKLIDIQIDNISDETYEDNIYWSFQSSTFSMIQVYDHHKTVTTYGSWQQTDQTLTLTFPDTNFQPIHKLYLDVSNEMKIIELSGKTMLLTQQSIDGREIKYQLTKW